MPYWFQYKGWFIEGPIFRFAQGLQSVEDGPMNAVLVSNTRRVEYGYMPT